MKYTKWRDERGGIISTLIALVFLAVLLGGIYLARRPLLRFAGESLVVEDPLEKSDTIIILSDDNFYADRATPRRRDISAKARAASGGQRNTSAPKCWNRGADDP